MSEKKTLSDKPNAHKGTSIYNGVSKRGNKWRVQLCILGVDYDKSGFETELDAALYHDRVVYTTRQQKGRERKLNFPNHPQLKTLTPAESPKIEEEKEGILVESETIDVSTITNEEVDIKEITKEAEKVIEIKAVEVKRIDLANYFKDVPRDIPEGYNIDEVLDYLKKMWS